MENGKITSLGIAALLSIFWVMPLSADKCPLEQYRIVGRIIEDGTTKRIEAARVFAFFDDAEETWANGWQAKYPDYFLTNRTGQFELTNFFYTGKGKSCDAKPNWLTLVVTADGYITKRRQLEIKKLTISGSADHRAISVPDTFLRRPQ